MPNGARPTHVRHVVLWLTVAAYMITYMDRVVMSTALPELRKELGFALGVSGLITGSFRWSYSIFQIPGGWMGDKFGPRKTLSLIVTWWSLFTSFTALAWNLTSMVTIRFLFGVGEAGAFPTATRSLSRWMLPRERGYAQGVTHAGSRLGAALTPMLVVPIMAAFGWRSAFWVFGALGLLWAIVWYVYYRDTPDEHPGVNDAERELIHSEIGGPRKKVGVAVPWRQILRSRTLWALCFMYACYQWGLAIYLDWFPTYLKEFRGFTLAQMGFYASLPLLAGMAGDLLGGWITDWLLKRTGNVTRSRRIVGIAGFLGAAIGIIPATLTADPYACVAWSCLAFGALEMTVAVSWAIPLDIAGDFAGSTSAVMNSAGNMFGAFASTVTGFFVEAYGWNGPFFVAAGLSVIGALLYSRIDASKKIAGVAH
jgi:MFS transporter, ACS family, glucarate transporter